MSYFSVHKDYVNFRTLFDRAAVGMGIPMGTVGILWGFLKRICD